MGLCDLVGLEWAALLLEPGSVNRSGVRAGLEEPRCRKAQVLLPAPPSEAPDRDEVRTGGGLLHEQRPGAPRVRKPLSAIMLPSLL